MKSFLRVAPFVVSLLLAGCTGANSTAEPVRAADSRPGDANTITLDEHLRQRVRVALPEFRDVSSELTVPARVEVNATQTSKIGAPVLGRVTQVLVEEGEEVREGQKLAVLYSTGLNDAQLDFLKALSQKQVAERAVARARTLLDAGVIGSAEMQRREAELLQFTAELEAAREELALLGMPPDAILELERTRSLKSVAWVISNRDGTVIHRRAAVGQVVQPADTLFEIADLSSVWVVADVPEKEIGHISIGLPASVEFDAIPGWRISAKLTFVSPLVNPETRTVVVRVELENTQRRLKPAMLASMTFHGHPKRMLCLPQESIVREDSAEYVFVRTDAHKFSRIPVSTIAAGRFGRAVLEPDLAGKEVIVAGAFHLNNELRRRNVRGLD
jgi:cobalt-zinc-cadmium efflux system membrane fusion protein